MHRLWEEKRSYDLTEQSLCGRKFEVENREGVPVLNVDLASDQINEKNYCAVGQLETQGIGIWHTNL